MKNQRPNQWSLGGTPVGVVYFKSSLKRGEVVRGYWLLRATEGVGYSVFFSEDVFLC